jgi:hypothetical protein
MIVKSRATMMALGCLLIGVFAGVVGAQVVQGRDRAHYLNTGLFSVGPGEETTFRVTLDDHRTGPPARVSLQLYDQNGAVLLADEVTLQPGESTALQLREPGVFRAHAQVLESPLRLSNRRTVVGTVELFDIKTTDPPRFVCSVAGQGRIPD